MINSYTITSQSVLVNETLDFDVTKVKTGCTITHTDGTASFSLNKPGFYFVTFNGDASSAVAGDITVQLLSNADIVPGASATVTAAIGNIYNVSFSTIVQVLPSCCACDNSKTLTIANTGVDATYTNANIVITKLC